MSEILEGMTREQALQKIWTSRDDCAIFMHRGTPYCNPLVDSQVGQMPMTEAQLEAAINSYYDALEAAQKPKWVEPTIELNRPVMGATLCELYYTPYTDLLDEEIARTNARREIEAFIRANGGGGTTHRWSIMGNGDNVRFSAFMCETDYPGLIYCASKELADEVCRRFPEQLKLLVGVK